MLARFKKFLKKEQLSLPKEKILLAVSGGVDSMVMMHLFKAAKLNFGVAHCNFQLRGSASDGDEILVKNLAEDWDVVFYAIRFNTIEEGKKQKKSTELIARELRYDWFAEILQQFDYQYVATAHHLNDSIETVLYNLTKGTGIRGLHGIPVKNDSIIRPLSFATRKDILDYAKQYKIPFRSDASNQSTKHNRNLIRLEVIPPLKTINPSLEQTFGKTLNHLKEVELLFNWAIAAHKKAMVCEKDDLVKIQKEDLVKEKAKATILFEFIREFGFHSQQIDQILGSIGHIGAQFYSNSHQLLIDRKELIIKNIEIIEPFYLKIETLPKEILLLKNKLIFKILATSPNCLNHGKNTALLDFNTIKFPIIIRNWKDGDRFYPLGMQGKSKKIKHYLSDEKVSRIEKEKVLVLESDGKIVWIIGYRMDERFKVNSQTLEILQLRIEEK